MPLIKMPKVWVSRRAKIVIGILITFSAMALVVLAFWSAWSNMFKRNDRFILTRFTVESADGGGWWHGKEDAVLRRLSGHEDDPEGSIGIVVGSTNLFSLDPEKIRLKLERVPEIESVKVQRILPNTLSVKITERTPVAILGKRGAFLLIDQEGVVIRRSRSLKITGMLPVIYGYRGAVPVPGGVFEELKSALEFIRLSKTAYSELKIVLINATARDYLVMRLYFKEDPGDYFDVWVPVENPELGMDRIRFDRYTVFHSVFQHVFPGFMKGSGDFRGSQNAGGKTLTVEPRIKIESFDIMDDRLKNLTAQIMIIRSNAAQFAVAGKIRPAGHQRHLPCGPKRG